MYCRETPLTMLIEILDVELFPILLTAITATWYSAQYNKGS